MGELGFDLSGRRPQQLNRELAEQADVVVTLVRELDYGRLEDEPA